jgi:hypothetical protein
VKVSLWGWCKPRPLYEACRFGYRTEERGSCCSTARLTASTATVIRGINPHRAESHSADALPESIIQLLSGTGISTYFRDLARGGRFALTDNTALQWVTSGLVSHRLHNVFMKDLVVASLGGTPPSVLDRLVTHEVIRSCRTRSAFLPTCLISWAVDGKERPLLVRPALAPS